MKDIKLGCFNNKLIRVKQLISTEQTRDCCLNILNTRHFRLFPTVRKSICVFNHATEKFQVGTERGTVLLFMFLFNQFTGYFWPANTVLNITVLSCSMSKTVFNNVLADTFPIVMHFSKPKRARGISLASLHWSHPSESQAGMSYLFAGDLFQRVL